MGNDVGDAIVSNEQMQSDVHDDTNNRRGDGKKTKHRRQSKDAEQCPF